MEIDLISQEAFSCLGLLKTCRSKKKDDKNTTLPIVPYPLGIDKYVI